MLHMEKVNGMKNICFFRNKRVIHNIMIAFSAQIFSLLVSVVVSLFFPRYMTVTEYAYWQLFSFYIGYAGVFHFGLNDGVYLKIGGTEYDALDFSLYKSIGILLLIVETVISGLMMVIGFIYYSDVDRRNVVFCVAIYLILNNITAYMGYIFQATNHTKWFSMSIIVEKAVYAVAIVFFVIVGHYQYLYLILMATSAKAVALIYCGIKGEKIVSAPKKKLREVAPLCVDFAKSGIFLMLANLSSTLIIGVGRKIMDWAWGIEEFGKFSLANSMTQFILLFFCQFSMVLFPELRRKNDESNLFIYKKMKQVWELIGPAVYIMYVPVCIFIKWWLPQYETSIYYFAFLIPICYFDGKMNIIFNTYLKVLNKQRVMLFINMIAVFISCIICSVGGFVIRNEYVVVLGIVVSIVIRSILAEGYLNKIMKIKDTKDILIILLEVFIMMAFWICQICWSGVVSDAILIGMYVVYLFLIWQLYKKRIVK